MTAREPALTRRASDAAGGAADATVAAAWLDGALTSGDGPVGAVLIALTRFDVVNAAYGRDVGDQLLAAAERRARLAAAALDGQVARIGGSEFLLAAAAAPDRIAAAADAIAAALALRFVMAGVTVALGSRIVTVQREPSDDAARMLRRAREALAAAKSIDVSEPIAAEPTGVAPLTTLAADLHRAIERDEIDVVFQPQVALADGAIAGAEALARWEHPRLGVLGAELLFAAADRADLGATLSEHVQALALARAAAWPMAFSRLRLSINVTAGDIARPDMPERFFARVSASGFPIGRLTAEVTETSLIADLDRAASSLAAVRAAGCRIAIDDFGTGYSSLAYLKSLPVDYLKLDRSLTRDIAGSARDQVVVRGILRIAAELEMAVIAEGVETERQRALLAEAGCAFYQGFLCSEPVDVTGLEAVVAEAPLRSSSSP